MNKLKLRRHETFCLREGWIQKGIEGIEQYGRDTFHKERGIKILGIGSNMVKSLKYWMVASNIIVSKINSIDLTDFGLALLRYDRYLEKSFSWCLIQYYLSSNQEESPVLYYIANKYNRKKINKEDLVNEIFQSFRLVDKDVNRDMIEEDVNMYTRLYLMDEVDDPEDNIISPLAYMKLLEKGFSNGEYIKLTIDPEELDYRVVFYALENIFEESFEVNSALNAEKSPVNIFNLDKGVFSQYLNIMKNRGLITINKTAGLNTVYFNRHMSISELFDDYFEGEAHV